jgi:excisionase family DNA binding protein
MMDKKTKNMLALTLSHIQKTNEFLSSVMELIQEIDEAASASTVIYQTAPKEFLTLEEAKELTGYSKTSLYQLINQGKIPCHRPTGEGGRIFFKRSEIETFLSRRKQSADYEISEKADKLLNREAK